MMYVTIICCLLIWIISIVVNEIQSNKIDKQLDRILGVNEAGEIEKYIIVTNDVHSTHYVKPSKYIFKSKEDYIDFLTYHKSQGHFIAIRPNDNIVNIALDSQYWDKYLI